MANETEVILEQMEGTRASLAQKLETLENQVVGTIQEATSTVSETVQQVKEAVTDTVETVKETVEGTVETVKGTVQDTVETVKETFDVRRQVENHPWLMFGGSFAAGFVSAKLMLRYFPADRFALLSWESVASAVQHFPESLGRMTHPASFREAEQGPTGRAYEMAEEARQRQPQEQKPGLLDSLTSMLGPEIDKFKGLAIGATLGIVRDLITQSAPPEIGSHLADIVNDMTSHLGGEVIHEPILHSSRGESSSRPQEHGAGSREPMAAAPSTFRTGRDH